MKRDYFISVAMATYNGEKYIKEQIKSILVNLEKNDELIISDDGSTDDTLKIIKSFKDKRIKIVDGPHDGIKQNFANAISKCKGKYIFLSDQDDIWMNNKVKNVLNVFNMLKCTLVNHNAEIVDENMIVISPYSTFEWRKSGNGFLKNIIKYSYIGCCMAFDSSLKDKILPIPNDIEMHDQWIGLINENYGKSYFLDEKLIKYRRHGANASKLKHGSLSKMFKNRIVLIKRLKGIK